MNLKGDSRNISKRLRKALIQTEQALRNLIGRNCPLLSNTNLCGGVASGN